MLTNINFVEAISQTIYSAIRDRDSAGPGEVHIHRWYETEPGHQNDSPELYALPSTARVSPHFINIMIISVHIIFGMRLLELCTHYRNMRSHISRSQATVGGVSLFLITQFHLYQSTLSLVVVLSLCIDPLSGLLGLSVV